ncbi:MAG: Omp28-related outer membrane protein [Flavobacterium sp.]|nr:Omp28-related outer membrane protein [Flavobacterium sp.]
MKKILLPLLAVIAFMVSCTKVESDFTTTATVVAETITLTANALQVTTNDTVRFTVTSSTNGNITGQSVIYVNGLAIASNSFVFSTEGTYAVYAKKDGLATAVLTVVASKLATPPPTTYVHRVLVEEYSGTWCGNCPQILYGVELLKQETNKAVVVGIHLFGGDPFISNAGNTLANKREVYGVPTGRINGTADWTTPQYNYVKQVTNLLENASSVGIAINSLVTNGTLNATVKVSYGATVGAGTKLSLYVVEDNLVYSQRNYYSNLYGGAGTISNFKYDGVLRDILTSVDGDAIANSGNNVTRTFSVNVPGNISNISKAKLVAFITDAKSKVLNVVEAPIGTNKDYEKL